jgi:hypothetical protein
MDVTPISTLEEQQDQLHLSSAEDIELLHNAIRTTTAGIFERAKQRQPNLVTQLKDWIKASAMVAITGLSRYRSQSLRTTSLNRVQGGETRSVFFD